MAEDSGLTIIIKQELLTCRRILALMIITCFMVQYMIRINMSIAVVEMFTKIAPNSTSDDLKYKWDENRKNDLLGIFFWGYLITAIPGGRLSEIYGTRVVLGIAMLVSSLLTIFTPLACYAHYYLALLVRFAMGLALGVSWPSIPPLAVKWVPKESTSKFMGHTMACSLGAAITLPVCGYLIAYLGWPSTFYITGAISLLWSFFWFYLVYDSPDKHPRISKEEKEVVLRETRCHNDFSIKAKIPWLKILTSKPVWAIIVADTCLQFNTNVIFNELPTYMDKVLHFDIKENGLLSSLPYFVTYLMAVLFTYIADRWRKMGRFSTITIRRLFTGIAFAVSSLLFLVQTFWGYDPIVSILVITLSQGFLAASTAGFISNSMDISPVYSGTIFGLAFTGGASTGYISTKVVAFLTREAANFEQWRSIFSALILINLFGGIFYDVFASAEVQKWNPTHNNEVELTKLRTSPEETKVTNQTAKFRGAK